MKSALLWFRSDLRLSDNPSLRAVLSRGDAIRALIPLYVLPNRLTGETPLGFPRIGPRRAEFLAETLEDLARQIERLGSTLIVVSGDPSAVISSLASAFDVDLVVTQDEPGTEEADELRAVQDALSQMDGRTLVTTFGQTLYHPDDLPFASDAIPDVYSEFRRAVEGSSDVHEPFPAPDTLPQLPARADHLHSMLQPTQEPGALTGLEATTSRLREGNLRPDHRAAIAFTGGSTAAWARLNEWIWERDRLRRYKDTRNGLLGADYSSKFSPWLANGAISPREIVAEVRRYEEQRARNKSTYWLVFELIWRDYFQFLARKYPREIFLLSGPRRRGLEWRRDRDVFEQWRTGTTGQPFIDANMRELLATGFMSNRGRQNVASYLARDLGIPWTWGAEWFESQLIDSDPASNYGNWTYAVGVGTDPRQDRYFNPVTQAERYDPKGRYVLHWSDSLDTAGSFV